MKQTKSHVPDLMALSAIALSGLSLSAAFAADTTFQWVGADDAASYYGITPMHSAAPISTNPLIWIAILLVSACILFCVYKWFPRRKRN